jgi:hypothetical protein
MHSGTACYSSSRLFSTKFCAGGDAVSRFGTSVGTVRGLCPSPHSGGGPQGLGNEIAVEIKQTKLKIKMNKAIILPVVLYGCETWALTLWEEHGLMVFENRVLFIYLQLFNDAVSSSDYIASNDTMINKLERMPKEAVVA